MPLSIDDFERLGFDVPPGEEGKMGMYIARAEIMINALCGGNAEDMINSESSFKLFEQALALEANYLYQTEESGGNLSRVTLGDLSYTEEAADKTSAEDIPDAVMKLLRAAGFFRGRGVVEVIE